MGFVILRGKYAVITVTKKNVKYFPTEASKLLNTALQVILHVRRERGRGSHRRQNKRHLSEPAKTMDLVGLISMTRFFG